MSPELSLFDEIPSAPLAIVATPGAKELAELIDKRLVAMYNSSAPKNARIKKDPSSLKPIALDLQTAMPRA